MEGSNLLGSVRGLYSDEAELLVRLIPSRLCVSLRSLPWRLNSGSMH